MRRIAVLLFAALCPAAQVPFVAVNSSTSPNALTTFNALNPTATAAPVSASLAGSFVRGLELEAATTGWYVATSATASLPTGFFRLEDGISTLVAPLPFLSTAVGGLSFNAAEDALYWVADPPSGEDELWRIDFNGTFTRIARIVLPSVAAPDFSGLALDPTTNRLYAIETNIDSLVLIDQFTGAASVVGPGFGLGVAISSVGGLDFSLDGTNRLFMASGTAVHQIDPTTGLALLPSTGNLPSSTSSIAAIPGSATLKAPAVSLGQRAQISIANGPTIGTFAIYFSGARASIQVPGGGVIRLDPASPLYGLLVDGPLSPQGGFVVPFVVPNDPSLSGLRVPLQAYTIDLIRVRFELTNAVDFRVL